MGFGFYRTIISQASRTVAGWIFVVGLLLIGFGVLILAVPEVFALLAASVFFLAGVGCAITATKIFLADRQLRRFDDSHEHRENVTIHFEEHYD